MKIVRNGVTVKSTDACPLITVNGKRFCLDKTCYLRNLEDSHCPPIPSEHALPDLMVGTTVTEFRTNFKNGLWDSKVVEE